MASMRATCDKSADATVGTLVPVRSSFDSQYLEPPTDLPKAECDRAPGVFVMQPVRLRHDHRL
jgi:hypothetical protein